MRTQAILATIPVAVAFASGCIITRETTIDREASRASGADVVPAESSGACGHGTAFHAVALVPGFESTDIVSARLSPDERTVYLSRPQVPGVPAAFDLAVATRATSTSSFGAPSAFDASTPTDDYWPTVSADGLSMFYEAGVQSDAGTGGPQRIWYATRLASTDPFAVTSNTFFDAVTPGTIDASPYLLPSANVLYWASLGRSGSTTSQDIWTAVVSPTGAVSNASRVSTIGLTDADEHFPVATDDNLELFFARWNRTGGDDAFVATRSAVGADWRAPLKVGGAAAINTADSEWPSWISPDACRLYFVRYKDLPGGGAESRLWVASRTPGEVASVSDVTCTYTRQVVSDCSRNGNSCGVSPNSVTQRNVPIRIRPTGDEYVIGGAGDQAYLAAGGTRHVIDLDARDVFDSFWSSGDTFALAGDPPAEAFQSEAGSPPELKTSLSATIAVTNAVETTVDLSATRWPPLPSYCMANCVKDTLECSGTAIADRP